CRLDDPSIRYGYPDGATAPWRFVFLAFYAAPELVDELLARHGPIYPLSPDAPVVEALLACERQAGDPMELAAGEAAALVHALLQALADAHTHAAVDTAAAQLVRAARRAIRESPNGTLNVSELAAGLGVSPEHLGRVFRRETGTTPLRTILRRRMRLAAEWLVVDGLSVKETAARLGYDTPSHFARAFRRVTGVAPRDYRRNPGLGVW
ncbi:MAG: helix-turn-helix transcriptional regulator, partial [Planctomycetota bacterium]